MRADSFVLRSTERMKQKGEKREPPRHRNGRKPGCDDINVMEICEEEECHFLYADPDPTTQHTAKEAASRVDNVLFWSKLDVSPLHSRRTLWHNSSPCSHILIRE
mmetsp:Transcript_5323/g.11724  ORF Transcript_5323/g.11724 Transcript_5323/m.11724 type:complete len:105 (-) Transcript_5323:927-1241(-)